MPKIVHTPEDMILRRTQYLSADLCPRCKRPLHYMDDSPRHVRGKGLCIPVALVCPRCGGEYRSFLQPLLNGDSDESIANELSWLADVTISARAEVIPRLPFLLRREARQ